jgi:hypothetical protein
MKELPRLGRTGQLGAVQRQAEVARGHLDVAQDLSIASDSHAQ